MKAQSLSKKKLIALSAAAMAIAIPAAMFGGTHSFASASEESGISPLDEISQPTLSATSKLVAVEMTYSVSNSSANLRLGQNVNPNYGYKTVKSNSYTVIGVPYAQNNGVRSAYYWGQAYVGSQSSSINYYSEIYNSQFPVTDCIISGTLTSSPKSLAFARTYNYIFVTTVYQGKVKEDMFLPNQSKTLKIDDMIFYVTVHTDHVTVSTSRTVTCNQFSGQDSEYAAFAYSGM